MCISYDEGICEIDEAECGYEEDFEECPWFEECELKEAV